MKINPGKTESLLLIKRNTTKIYNKIKVGNNTIEIKKSMKYLGFVLDKGPTIQRHIEDRVSKATGTWSTLYPMIHRRSNITRVNKLLMYVQIIRQF